MESRPQIVTDEQGRHYVVLLGLSPNNLFCKEYNPRVKKETEKDTGKRQSKGVEQEVKIIEINSIAKIFAFKL